jgi:hypothetical protein
MSKKYKTTTIILFLLFSIAVFTTPVNAQNTQLTPPAEQNKKIVEKDKENNPNFSCESQIKAIHSLLNIQQDTTEQKLKNLEVLISSQKETIKSLELELKSQSSTSVKSGMTFEVWMGFLLAIAALVLGAVGIGVAVVTFIGYKDLIKKGTYKASIVAKRVAKIEVDILINNGGLTRVIEQIVNDMLFRGIPSGTELEAEEINNDVG